MRAHAPFPGRPFRSGQRSTATVCIAVLAAIVYTHAAYSQALHDSKGKEFWVTFMESAGGGGVNESSDMRLYLSADSATEVTITYNGNNRQAIVSLPEPHKTVEVNLNALFGRVIELEERDAGVSNKSLHVIADHDFTLYGVSVRLHSSDAFLGLPDDALTRRYVVLSYPNGYNDGFGQFPGYDHPSEFAVIATEDGTTLTITPSAQLNNRANLVPFTVGLNRGQVYFAQASLNGEQDVSGTQIRSTKPVAVFGGNRRTSIPTTVGNYRDHLVEQMPPLDAWGTSAILTPHFEITPAVTYPAVARTVAALDNTTWSIDGVPQPTLRGGEVVEITMRDQPMVIRSNNPIMVAQYEHSVGIQENGAFELGDPFMMLIPPPEQYDTAYAFQSVTHELFTRHYINVVVPSIAVPSLHLDGVPLVANYQPIPGTPYSYAQIALSAGSHYVTCDSAFGLYAYGFGQANSYGYPGGTLFRQLVVDFEHPFITTVENCGTVNGVAIDDRITDSGIDSCYVVASGSSNTKVSIVPFAPGSDSVFYTASLIDPYQDGTVTVKAIDSAGRSISRRNTIPGYTVRASRMTGNAAQVEETVSYNRTRVCRQVEIVNYGQFPQVVNYLALTPGNPLFRIDRPLGFTLAPGGRDTLNICYDGGPDTIERITLVIGDSCVTRQVVDLIVHSITDTVPPTIAGVTGPCGQGVNVVFEEPGVKYHGIAAIEVIDAVNARTSFDPDPASLPSTRVALHLDPVDFRQDMIYEVEMRDLAGNATSVRDTVGGYTIAALDTAMRTQVSVRLGNDWETKRLAFLERRCDSIVLTNYGSRDIVIDRIVVEENREFSVPPAQLPMRIGPGDSIRVAICLEGRYAGDQIDTLLIVDTCGRWERVALRTPVGYGLGNGVDRCGQELSIQAFAPSKRTFLTAPFPNPSNGGEIGVDIGLSRDENVSIDVLDLSGERVLRVLDGAEIKGGVHRLRFAPVGLESGLYFCRMTTGSGATYTSKMVVRR